MMRKLVVVAGMLAIGLGAVMAEQDQVKQTQSVMKGNDKNAGALVAMVKGKTPYDQATVDAALAQFEETAKKLPTLFPASLKGKTFDGKYQPSAKIWQDPADFNKHIESFGKAIEESKGKIKDLATLKAALPVIGDQCDGCHKTYRIKKG